MRPFEGWLLGLFLSAPASAQPARPVPFTLRQVSGTPASGFRALAAVSDSVAWVSGTGGWTGRTVNGGRSWRWIRVPGAEALDFRGLAASDSLCAVTASAGCPAAIYRTGDGGLHWARVFYSTDSTVFLDGILFSSATQGLAYGDPQKGRRGLSRFFLLRTGDGGRRWKPVPQRRRPVAVAGEAAFAASNSAMAGVPGSNRLWLVTGGTVSRALVSTGRLRSWQAEALPVLAGKGLSGAFSVAFSDTAHGAIAGGDYASPGVRFGNFALTRDGGRTWKKPLVNPFGYRSTVLFAGDDTLLASGPTGTDLSVDGGLTWQAAGSQGFNVAASSPGSHTVFLAGANGRLAILVFSTKYTHAGPSGLPSRGE